jgi:hypothetical protein
MQGCQIGYILEGLGIENVGVFCGHLKYFTTIGYVLWPLGIFSVNLVNFFLVPRKIWQPRLKGGDTKFYI